ncbi:flavin reductase family protein [Paraburkholderia acidisoli]|uniref:Flavin reductase family protein n=1 Tax=Paraburkholderia acidisoli TaxID=2571748 RepID=A0A7Z2GNR3_9BURK|nr:flavin reductase family protein [Paraburkholderia acidisoli]QGZ65113.1 flavin reductase family protein [Paraburkholderia acidisoli]
MFTSASPAPHLRSEPSILYLGTPVVLLSTLNEDGTANLAPLSSVFWLGWRGVLGIGASQTALNLVRTQECVINLPSHREVASVDAIARTTARHPVPEWRQSMGYEYEPDKFARAGMTPVASETVGVPRALECPIQLEAVLAARHEMNEDTPQEKGRISIFEVRITRVHVLPELLLDGNPNRIDPDRWSPLIMSFQKFYGLTLPALHPSRLAEVPEDMYRSHDVDRARGEVRPRSEQAEAA